MQTEQKTIFNSLANDKPKEKNQQIDFINSIKKNSYNLLAATVISGMAVSAANSVE